MPVKFLVISAFLTIATGPAAQAQDVFVAPIKGTIEKGLAAFVVRVVDDARDANARALILEIDTPGGALDAALTIRDALLYTDLKTIAFVNPRAISAGALISLATDHIVMAEGGTIGAATAVDLQGNKASEKVISYFRNEMKATAEKTRRPPRLAEAMVDEDVDIEGLAPKGKLLTLTTEEAVRHGIADHKVTAEDEAGKLREVLGLYGLEGAKVHHLEVNWAEQAVRWLTHPVVASLLMTLGFLGLIFEIQSPGWGVGGTVALVCLGLFFGSHLLVNLADWTEVLLFAIGLGFVIVDVFLVAGFGLLAVPGFVLMLASIFLSLMGRMDLWTIDSVGVATRPILAAVVLTAILGFVIVRRLPRTRTWSRVVLHAGEEGYRASAPENESLMGREGIAFTALRPGGTGLFGDLRASVTTEGDYLEKNTAIRVVEVEGNRIVVRRA